MKIIDLTLPLFTGMPVYPGDPESSFEVIKTLEKDGWEMRRIEMNGHDRTHVNVPSHALKGGKNLDDFKLESFGGFARIYSPGITMSPEEGIIFRDQNIDTTIAEKIKKERPKFVGLGSKYEFDEEVERDLLHAGIISYERLENLEELPTTLEFYGMPLNIKGGDGSPVRAFALIR